MWSQLIRIYTSFMYILQHFIWGQKRKVVQNYGGSVVECLTGDRGATDSSFTSVTVFCPWARHINPGLVLIQPRKTRPYITERLLMGRKESNQTNKCSKIRTFTVSINFILLIEIRTLAKSAYQKVIFLFLNQNICCGYSKEVSRWNGSFKHPKTYVKTDG